MSSAIVVPDFPRCDGGGELNDNENAVEDEVNNRDLEPVQKRQRLATRSSDLDCAWCEYKANDREDWKKHRLTHRHRQVKYNPCHWKAWKSQCTTIWW